MIQLSKITKNHGGRLLFDEASFTIYPGEKIGLVGPNGAGKTTIFNLIAGEEKPDEGTISIQNLVKIAYFSQNVGEMRGRTALEEVVSGNARIGVLSQQLHKLEKQVSNPDISAEEMTAALNKLGDVQTEYEELGGYNIESTAEEILTNLGIAPEDHSKMVEDFSGGWKMRIALAKVLIVMPDLILMDEPTNYLDMETIIWIEKWLQNFKGAILMTSHDREFMNKVVKKIIEVSQGNITTYSGDYEFYLREKEIRKKQNEASVERQAAMLKKEEEFIAKFKARASHAAQVQSRVKKIEKIERVELIKDEEEMNIYLPEIPRGGNDVVVIKNLGKVWVDSTGREKRVFKELSFIISRQDKVAVVGVNGAGKSTLLKIICGQTDPTEGNSAIGQSINTGYFSQHALEVLNGNNTIFEELFTKLPDFKEGTIRSLLGSFLFKGDDIYKKIKVLSGGEKARVLLATLLAKPNNFLVLDEPTNHLDITSREVLLEALQRYQGTIMIVSHDRYFLHHLSNKVLEIASGSAHLFKGKYQEYLDMKEETQKR